METNKSVLEMTSSEAEAFFLKNESYCNIPLPPYFSFSNLLQQLSNLIKKNEMNLNSFFKIENAKNCDEVNYTIYGNKDGKLSYRPLELIHPLIYVSLVKNITEEVNWGKLKSRFKENFQKKSKIKCLSIPVESQTGNKDQAEQILNWWNGIEQASIDLYLEYHYMYDTDIADCYGSIYTHSIAWAIETKEVAKTNRKDKKLLGNSIDIHIQSMRNGQTNGIPQGSILMDFIAEIVLGYIDELLTEELKNKGIDDYKILRYRDDYKIFVNNTNDGLNILKTLSQILIPFGLKLNTSKTRENKDIIIHSIKKDKLEWLKLIGNQDSLKTKQKQLLLIYQHSIENPNSGSLVTALSSFNKDLKDEKSAQIISISVSIMLNNPKTVPVCSSIISKVLKSFDESEKKDILEKVYIKIKNMANSDIAQIWLQRIIKSKIADYKFDEKLCKLVRKDDSIKLWNSEWITGNNDFKRCIERDSIFDQDKFDKLDETIESNEYEIFYKGYI